MPKSAPRKMWQNDITLTVEDLTFAAQYEEGKGSAPRVLRDTGWLDETRNPGRDAARHAVGIVAHPGAGASALLQLVGGVPVDGDGSPEQLP
jgi:hypothetical protein